MVFLLQSDVADTITIRLYRCLTKYPSLSLTRHVYRHLPWVMTLSQLESHTQVLSWQSRGIFI